MFNRQVWGEKKIFCAFAEKCINKKQVFKGQNDFKIYWSYKLKCRITHGDTASIRTQHLRKSQDGLYLYGEQR